MVLRTLGTLSLALGILTSVAASTSAATFTWTYSGAACTEAVCGDPVFFPPVAMEGHGTLQTIPDPSATFSQRMLVTSISGVWNNIPISGIFPVNTVFNDNHLYFPEPVGVPAVKLLNVFGLGFALADAAANPGGVPTGVNLFWEQSLASYVVLTFNSVPYGDDFATGASFGTFSVAPTPLPGAIALFATGLAGLGWFARRRRREAVA